MDIRIYVKYYCILFFLFFILGRSFAFDKIYFNKYFKLLPQPQNIQLRNGKGIFFNEVQAIQLKGLTKKPVMSAYLNCLPESESSGNGVVTLIKGGDFKPGIPESPEGYLLEINDKSVKIWARTDAGIFYGCQTLSQLMEDSHEQHVKIPACIITDYPGIAYRAVHLDIKYHLDNMNYYYQMMDRLASVKINAVIVELEDKLRYKSAAAVGCGNAISIEEFASLTWYARERNIEISPLVQGLGHVSFILKHAEFKYLRDDPKSEWVFDPLNPDTYTLQFKLYDDAMAATPGSKYLHIGGDEVYNLGRSERCRKSGLASFELQMIWLNKVCVYAKEHNRIPVFWDDMIYSHTGLYSSMQDADMNVDSVNKLWKDKAVDLDKFLPLFPKDCIFMRWHYDNPRLPGNMNAINWLKAHHLSVMGACAAQDMSPMIPRRSSLFAPMSDFCAIATEKKLEGMLTTTWDDSSPHFETFWRGIYDYAGLCWKYETISSSLIHARFRHRFYSPALSNDKFEFQDSLENAVNFWDTAFVKGGGRTQVPKKLELIELPVKDSSVTWLKDNTIRIRNASIAIQRYKSIKLLIDENIRLAVRNQFALELFKQMNELQVYDAKLLLLIEEFAISPNKQDNKIVKKIASFVDEFDDLRHNYEMIFSKTRFLERPADYIMDDNDDRMLANSTRNTDWMYLYELAMNEKVTSWIKTNF